LPSPDRKPSSKSIEGNLVMVNTTEGDSKLLSEITAFLSKQGINYTPAVKVSGKIEVEEHKELKGHNGLAVIVSVPQPLQRRTSL